MTEPSPTPEDDFPKEATSLFEQTEAAADRALKQDQGRVARAAWFLEAQAGGFLFAVIPTLLISAVVILIGTKDRSAPVVLFAMVVGVFTALVLSGLLGGLAALLRENAAQAEALGRIAASLEGRRREAVAAAPAAVLLPAPDTAETARQAVRARRWDDAAALVQAFNDAHAGHPDAARLADELAEARRAAREELIGKIEAARGVNEPERVIELRDELKPLIDADALRTLDRDLAKWFMMLIHRRLRTGSVRPDVAVLAGRVADRLDETPEGASLRASLPTLRRAAGLCPRCAQPYTGIADACPSCLTGAAAATATALPSAPLPDEPADEPDPEPLDLNDPETLK